MPEDLKERVIGYYEYMWQRKKGVSTEGIYKDLPVTFQAEVSHAINSSTLQTVSPVLQISPQCLKAHTPGYN